MIRLVDDMPPGTIGLEALGKVTDEDYTNILVPAVTQALAANDVRLLYVLGDDFDSYSAGAMWADTKLWSGHIHGWQRIAVVTNHRWIHDGVNAFTWLMPGEVRTFDVEDVEAAKKWLAS